MSTHARRRMPLTVVGIAASVCLIEGGAGTYGINCDGKEIQGPQQINLTAVLQSYLNKGYEIKASTVAYGEGQQANYNFVLTKQN